MAMGGWGLGSNQVTISRLTLKIYWFPPACCCSQAPRAASSTSEVSILTRRPAAGRSLFSFLSERAATGASDSYWEGRQGTRAEESSEGKQRSRRARGNAAALRRPWGAVTWPAPTKRRAGDASESRRLADHCWSTPGWCLYDKHSRQLATKVLLQH